MLSNRIIALHKPIGFEVTRPKVTGQQAYRGQKTVYELLPPEFHSEGWVPVGRLDKATSGLILFVREGRLVFKLQKPGNLEKVYEVWVRGPVEPEHLEKIREGVLTPIGILKAKAIEILGEDGNRTYARVVLDEGKNRQVRRLFAALWGKERQKPLKVLDLKRTHFGPIALDLEPGQWRFLTDGEVEQLLGGTVNPPAYPS
jgi:23S rRNA pseudouridine2605 synthase